MAIIDHPDPNLKAVEKAILKSPPPSDQRGIHELIGELEATLELVMATVLVIKQRLDHFDRLQSDFYNGRKS